MATDPNTLVNNAKCLACIPVNMQMPVLIYILAVKAGIDPTNINSLMEQAKCLGCQIPPGMQTSVLIALFDQAVNP